MEVEKIKNTTAKRVKYYEVKVKTMEGDADDYHNVDITFEDDEEGRRLLRECVIACEIISKHYPHGVGGGYNFYKECPYWNKWFSYEPTEEYDDNIVTFGEEWHWECDTGTPDSFENYSVNYYDDEGVKHACKLTFDKEMELEITSAKKLK